MTAAVLAAAGPQVLASGFGEAVVSGSMLVAIPVALLAGFVSFASPCVLPLVPGYLGYVSGWAASNVTPTGGAPAAVGAAAGTGSVGSTSVGPTSTTSTSGGAARGVPELRSPHAARARTVAGVALFVAGFTLVFVVLGGFVGALGTHVWAAEDTLTRVLGVVVVLMGLAFMGFLPFLQREARLHVAPRAGLWGAPLLGIVFGLGWTPCLGPTLVAVYALALDQATVGRGASLAVAYCLGLGLPFLAIAFGLQSSQALLGWLRRHRLAVMRTGGALLVVVGVAMVAGVWGDWTSTFGGWVSRFGVSV